MDQLYKNTGHLTMLTCNAYPTLFSNIHSNTQWYVLHGAQTDVGNREV